MTILQTSRGAFRTERRGDRKGPPLVFVSGVADDHSSWAAVIEPFAKEYDCITFDNRGIGESPITRGPYSIDELAQDTQAIASALGIENVTAVGSSMGGAICQAWALSHPAMVRRLVLSNIYARCDAFLGLLLDHWIGLAEREAVGDLMQVLRYFCFSPNYVAGHAQLMEDFLKAPAPDLKGFAAQAHACRRHDLEPRLGEIEADTLLIGGTEDILTRPEHTRRMAERMPKAQLAWLPTGHMTFWEQPEEWAALLRSFLARSPVD